MPFPAIQRRPAPAHLLPGTLPRRVVAWSSPRAVGASGDDGTDAVTPPPSPGARTTASHVAFGPKVGVNLRYV
jgi:hypothetical protein